MQPKHYATDWTEGARLWGAIVGPPSVLKSPVIRVCTAPVDALEVVARQGWGQDMAAHKVAHKAWKAAVRDDPTLVQPLPPHCPRYLVEDATIAALSEVLRAERNPTAKCMPRKARCWCALTNWQN